MKKIRSIIGVLLTCVILTSTALALTPGGGKLTPSGISLWNKSGTELRAKDSSVDSVCDYDGGNCLTFVGGSSPVTSVFSRTGAIVATDGDYTQAKITGLKTTDSPTFAGGVYTGTLTGTTIVASTALQADTINENISGSGVTIDSVLLKDNAVTATTFNGALSGNSSTATALAANPTDCGANTWATTIAASGNLTCSAVTYAGITAMTSANLASIVSDESGTGVSVFSNSPTLVTPSLGVATGTSFNGVALTTGGAGTGYLADDGTYKAVAGGGLTWGDSITSTSGIGVTILPTAGATAGLDITVDSVTASVYNYTIGAGIRATNTNASDSNTAAIVVENNVANVRSHGIRIEQANTSAQASNGLGSAFNLIATAASQVLGLVSFPNSTIPSGGVGMLYSFGNTQANAGIAQKIDLGSSAQAHVGLYITGTNASTSANMVQLVGGSGYTGDLLEATSASGSITSVRIDDFAGLIPAKTTSDPCGSMETGAIFYNSTSNYFCYCNGAGADVQIHSPGTACF